MGSLKKNSGGTRTRNGLLPERRVRVRELGIEIGMLSTGRHNAITDVAGVSVGHVTLRSGSGKLAAGKGPVRTGVTAIIPHQGDIWNDRVSAASYTLNGNGEVSGLAWVKESGLLEGPILLTNTLSVHAVADGAISWMLDKFPGIGVDEDTYLPVVGECDDSALNDIRGRHVRKRHVLAALDGATTGPVEEGAVGAGTGMISFRYKAGIGTASRKLPAVSGGYTVGVLVNSNFGSREQLRVDGVAVGRSLSDQIATEFRDGSICIIVATDAPMSALQLERLAKRACLGLARTGAVAQNGSGDFVVAFSTSRKVRRDAPGARPKRVIRLPELNVNCIDPLFEAVAEATEEAVLNSLFMAQTTVGRDGNVAHALPLERCKAVLRAHGRKLRS